MGPGVAVCLAKRQKQLAGAEGFIELKEALKANLCSCEASFSGAEHEAAIKASLKEPLGRKLPQNPTRPGWMPFGLVGFCFCPEKVRAQPAPSQTEAFGCDLTLGAALKPAGNQYQRPKIEGKAGAHAGFFKEVSPLGFVSRKLHAELPSKATRQP